MTTTLPPRPTREERIAVNQQCTHTLTRQGADEAPGAMAEGFCSVCRIPLTPTQDQPWCTCCGFVWTPKFAEAVGRIYVKDGPMTIKPLDPTKPSWRLR